MTEQLTAYTHTHTHTHTHPPTPTPKPQGQLQRKSLGRRSQGPSFPLPGGKYLIDGFKIYMYYGEWGLLLSCGEQASHCEASLVAGHRLRAQASVVVAHGSVVWAARLQSTGSIAGAPQLSCSTACGVFLDQEWNLCLLHWQETTAWYSETKQLGKFVCISGEEMGRIKRRVMVALIWVEYLSR